MSPVDPSNLISSSVAASSVAPQKKGARRRKTSGSAEIRLGQGYDKLIQQAMTSETADPATIQKARDALNAQELDTLEAAQRAAENISKLGI